MSNRRERNLISLQFVPFANTSETKKWQGLESHLLAVALILCILFYFGSFSLGGTIRHDQDDSDYRNMAANYKNVGRFKLLYSAYPQENTITGSGTLVAPDWVLTGAHLFDDNSKEGVQVDKLITAGDTSFFDFDNMDDDTEGNEYYISTVLVHENWDGSNPKDGWDIALVRLTRDVLGTEAANLFEGPATAVGLIGTIVGFGNSGTGETGWIADTFGTKRAGNNTIDLLGNQYWPTFLSERILLLDFDAPDWRQIFNRMGSAIPLTYEYLGAVGDSGGGVFINVGGEPYLAGISSFVSRGDTPLFGSNSGYNDIMGATKVSFFVTWINQYIRQRSYEMRWNRFPGYFSELNSWSVDGLPVGAIPGEHDIAIFEHVGSGSVSLQRDITNDQLIIDASDLIFANNYTYTLLGRKGTSVIIGQGDGSASSIQLRQGDLICSDVKIGDQLGTNGSLELGIRSRFSVDELYVGYHGHGTMKIADPGANATVRALLRFGTDSAFIAVVGTAIHMESANFTNESENESALTGLGNLGMVFQSEDTDFNTLELAGIDLGASLNGFVDNFHLNTLTLGCDAGIGLVKLVDDVDNGNRGDQGIASEVLYTNTLIINEGSVLDLNGYTLYTKSYRDLIVGQYSSEIEGINFNGGSLVIVGRPDLNEDKIVNFLDFTIVANRWADECSAPNWCEEIDFDKSGKADFGDLRVLAGHWLQTPPQYELTVTVAGGNGSVTPTYGTYFEGTAVTLTATPEPGYQVKAWHGTDNDSSKANTNIVTMYTNRTVTVEFESFIPSVISLMIDGQPAPYVIYPEYFDPVLIGLQLLPGASCTGFDIAFVLSNTGVGQLITSPYMFPADFDYEEILESDPFYVRLAAAAFTVPVVEGPVLMIDQLSFFPFEFPSDCETTLSVVVGDLGFVINGTFIPPGTVLFEVIISYCPI